MTLLHCDGFDAKTANIAGGYTLTAGSYTDTQYVTGRSGTGFAITSNVTGGSTGLSVPITSSTTVIVGIAIKNGSGGYFAVSYGPGCILCWRNAGTDAGFLKVNSTAIASPGLVTVCRGTVSGGGTPIGSPTTTSATVPSASFQYVEIKIVCSTTAGSITVKQDGVVTYNQSGLNTGSAAIDEIEIPWKDPGTPYGYQGTFDDLYICNSSGSVNNDFLGDVKVLSLLPTGNGSSSQLVGSDGNSTDNYLLVDEVPPTTADYASSSTVTNKDLYVYSDVPAGYIVKGIQVQSYTATDSGAPTGRAIVKSGATTGNSSDHTLSSSAKIWRDTFETDPNTTAAWTLANVNAAEFGWEVRS